MTDPASAAQSLYRAVFLGVVVVAWLVGATVGVGLFSVAAERDSLAFYVAAESAHHAALVFAAFAAPIARVVTTPRMRVASPTAWPAFAPGGDWPLSWAALSALVTSVCAAGVKLEPAAWIIIYAALLVRVWINASFFASAFAAARKVAYAEVRAGGGSDRPQLRLEGLRGEEVVDVLALWPGRVDVAAPNGTKAVWLVSERVDPPVDLRAAAKGLQSTAEASASC